MSKEISSTNINNNFDYHDKGNTNKYSVINNVNAPNAGTLQVYIDSKSGNKIKKLLIGYWGSWSVYRDGVLKFDTSHIDAILFTHLIYCFFAPTSDGEIEHIDVNVEMISKFRGLKSSNPECKLMAAVGGSDEARSRAFSQMASNPSSREKFARNALKFLNRYGFDGLDIHWLYPESGDKENLVLLLQSIKLAFKSSNHILSIAVGPTKYRGDRVYDVPGIESNVDFINLMTYDLHQAYEGVTGSNSSLYAGPAANQEHNVDACVLYWRSEGAPNEKIIVGLPTYGKTFQLSDALRNGLNEPISGNGTAGLSNLPGTLSFLEISSDSWTTRWQDDQKVPFAYRGDQWVSYENVQSMKKKAEYIRDNKLGGAMFWSIEFEDFSGVAGNGKNPLINAVAEVFNAQ